VHETEGYDSLYRTADLDPLRETEVMEIDLTDQRHKLMSIFEERFREVNGLVKQFRQMLSGPLPTADIADLIAFNLLEDVPQKQTLLAETDVVKRVGRVIAALEQIESIKPPIEVPATEDASLN